MADLLDAALALARRGKPVFPVDLDKAPLTEHGFKNATADEAQIRMLPWARAAGIAIPTGTTSAVWVVDVDPRNGGDVAMGELEVKHGKLPATLTAATGGGGLHIYFTMPPGSVRWRKEIGRGLDVKADGGYVVTPPSNHASGKPYSWINPKTPIADAPAWLLALATRTEKPRETQPRPTSTEADRGTAYGRAALDREIAKVRAAAEGERNRILNTAAYSLGQLIAAGVLDETTVKTELLDAADTAGLGEREAEKTMRSGLDAGMRMPRNIPPPSAPGTRTSQAWAPPSPKIVNSVCLADVAPEHVTWLWPGRIAWGKIGVIDGDPGLGKSTVTLDLAARGSRGLPMPSAGGSTGIMFSTILLSAEDGLGDTIARRLRAHEADLTKIHAITGIGEGADSRLPALPGDVRLIEAEVIRVAGRVLIVIDPIMAYFGHGIDAHKDGDVRRALAPLAAMAERTGAAVVLVRHLNKNANGSALQRGGGSIAIAGAARSVLLVAKDPADENARILAPVKSNLGRPAPSLKFHLVDAGGVARVEWLGASTVSADQLVRPPEVEEPGAAQSAQDFLRTVLANGPILVTEVKAEAKILGISERTLERAKVALEVVSSKGVGFAGKWRWSLPTDQDRQVQVAEASKAAKSSQDRQDSATSHFVGGLTTHPLSKEEELLLLKVRPPIRPPNGKAAIETDKGRQDRQGRQADGKREREPGEDDE